MPLDQPLFIVVIFEFLQGGLELFDSVEGSDPQQIFLECSDEALGATVALRGAHKGRDQISHPTRQSRSGSHG